MSKHLPLSLSRCLLPEVKRVWDGIFGIRDFTRNIAKDSTKRLFIDGILDFTAARASGWAEVLARATGCGIGKEHGILGRIDRNSVRGNPAGFSWKTGGNAGSGPPFQTLFYESKMTHMIETYDRNTCFNVHLTWQFFWVKNKAARPTINRFSLFWYTVLGKQGREIRYS